MVSYGLKMNKLIQSFLSRSPAGARQTAEREQTAIYYSLLSRTVCEISEFCFKASLSNVSTHTPQGANSQPDPLYSFRTTISSRRNFLLSPYEYTTVVFGY